MRDRWQWGVQAALWLAVGAIAANAVVSRLPGWNPRTLRADDLIYGAIIRSDDPWAMFTVPIHVAPGLFPLLRGLYGLLPDPEWSLQFLPFACGIAAIPVMALTVRNLTRDDTAAVIAAAVTALNPLLAHYSILVRQYPIDFLTTALFLLAATHVLHGREPVDARRFGWLCLGGGLAPFLSVTSVLTSLPLVALGAAPALIGWLRHRGRTHAQAALRMALCAAGYGTAVLAAYVVLRNRSNPSIRDYWDQGFMPLAPAGAWDFLVTNGRHLMELSLPLWETAEHSAPFVSVVNPDGRGVDLATWPLPLLALGLVWLLRGRDRRRWGMLVCAFYALFLVASALHVYPLGTGRPDIFAFPVAIVLLAGGIHAVGEKLPRPRIVRLAAASIVVALALMRPIHVEYWTTDDVRLVDYLSAGARVDDAIILSHGGGFLTAFYGRWPVLISPHQEVTYGTQATVDRALTLQLPWNRSQAPIVSRFLSEIRPQSVWYVAYRARLGHADVLSALRHKGYAIHTAQTSADGSLYLAINERGAE